MQRFNLRFLALLLAAFFVGVVAAYVLKSATAGILLFVVGAGVLAWRQQRHIESLKNYTASLLRENPDSADYNAPTDDLIDIAENARALAKQLGAQIAAVGMENAETNAILDSMVEAVLALDAEGKLVRMNPAAETILRQKEEHALGKRFFEVVRQPKLSEMVKEALGGRSAQNTLALFLPEETIFEASAKPLPLPQSKRGALIVLHDITRQHALEKMRREFIAGVSHELRTPLTTIQGFAETLLDGALNDKKHSREFVETIYQQAQALTALVNDILDLSAIELGRRKLQPSAVALEPLLKSLQIAFELLAQKAQVTLEILPEGIESWPSLWFDPTALRQVLVNLIDNAIKYNAKGRVWLTAEVAAQELILTIHDSGIGIPKEDLPRIFERFYRVEKTRNRELGGTGLGLAIVKHLVEMSNGKITVQSTLGLGSAFTLRLPIHSNKN